VRNYLDVLIGLPWGKKTKLKHDLANAEEVLNQDHFGLDKVKDRILEYLAVQQRVDKVKAPILCLVGPPGVGKSHLVCALGHALIDVGRRVLFMRCSDLVQRLQAARRDLRLPQELSKLDRFDLLILDDLSYVRRDQAETSVLFELIAERYERKSLAITANTPFSQWGEVFVEPAMTLAAVDRLVHHSTILEMNVESYRRRAAQQGLAPAARKTR
jgi:DNA replication protein DnaC